MDSSTSLFWIELKLETAQIPLSKDIKPTSIANRRAEGAGQLHTLLYVEDNPANLMLVEGIIERRPEIRLISARDGIQGVELARAALPDAILMDINLPGMSGTDAMRVLADDPITAHIPVIALSANAIPRDVEQGLQAGFFRYLTKPIKVVEFMQTVDEALNFSRIRSKTRH